MILEIFEKLYTLFQWTSPHILVEHLETLNGMYMYGACKFGSLGQQRQEI